jgi:phosphoribosylamine--glycine ligase
VVLAAAGYPEKYAKGLPISGLSDSTDGSDDGKVFHAGSRLEAGTVVTNGGRVLCATALGDSIDNARDAAYALCRGVHWDGAFYRKDIAWRALERDS